MLFVGTIFVIYYNEQFVSELELIIDYYNETNKRKEIEYNRAPIFFVVFIRIK